MNKWIKVVAISSLALSLIACGSGSKESSHQDGKLKVAATANPHGTILEKAKPILKEKYGIELEVSITDDYYIPNEAVSGGSADANFFQHVPFFDNQKKEKGYKLVNVGGVHIEPFGIYAKTIRKVSDVKDGATVIISNSVADNANVLKTTIADIDNDTNNPKHLKFQEVKPELLATAYANGEGDLVAINGNYAISAGLKPSQDALILEKATAKNPYVNIVVCQEGHEKEIKALVEVLQSKEIKDFIKSNWSDGSVIPSE